MNLFALVLARDKKHVKEKIKELEDFHIPFIIVCGENIDDPRVKYREPRGKFDAINYGVQSLPPESDLILMNDVDTKIYNLNSALHYFKRKDVALVFARVQVDTGPQKSFYKLLDPIRRRIHIAASGELMIIRKELLQCIAPLKPSKAEDSYIMFKILESGKKVVFSEKTYVKTERTKKAEDEEKYKRRTVGGLYQALSYSKPPLIIRTFYRLLPLVSPLLLVLGTNGYFWMKGILHGFVDYLRGDQTGHWKAIY
jgi:cellulose synthase/poly-beta-1,6-N-acetylglucosamine synthase-like glycosyltransferase